MDKKVKAVKALVVCGVTYKTASGAARQWATWVRIRKSDRKTKILGYAAYHDREWFESAPVRNSYQTAYRRSLPIFTKFFKG